MLQDNTSHHYTLLTKIRGKLTYNKMQETEIPNSKIKWDKVDMNQYQTELKKKMIIASLNHQDDTTYIEKNHGHNTRLSKRS